MIRMKRILVATDLSPLSECAVRYGCELVAQFNARLELLNVVWYPFTEYAQDCISESNKSFEEYEQAARESAEASLNSICIEPLSDRSRVGITIRMGSPVSEIVKFARENEIDMLVLGTHGHSGLKHVLMGSVAERVVQNAPCPVLTVRDSAHEFAPV